MSFQTEKYHLIERKLNINKCLFLFFCRYVKREKKNEYAITGSMVYNYDHDKSDIAEYAQFLSPQLTAPEQHEELGYPTQSMQDTI